MSTSFRTKMLIAGLLIGIILGGEVYLAIHAGSAGCDATHAVIRNVNDYFRSQLHRIQTETTFFSKHPVEKARLIARYARTIRALSHVHCY